jgi:hypothetical protein
VEQDIGFVFMSYVCEYGLLYLRRYEGVRWDYWANWMEQQRGLVDSDPGCSAIDNELMR